MGDYNHSIPVDAKIMVSTNCPIIGEQIAVKAGVHAKAVFTSLNTAFHLGHVSSDAKSLCLFH